MSQNTVRLQTLSDSALKAEVEIKAAPEKVYAAWTKPEQLAKWFGPRSGGSLQVDHFDCSVGGRYDVTMLFADGDRAQIVGAYQELDPPKKIVMTWQLLNNPASPNETLVTVDLIPTPSGTQLTLLHERFASAAVRDEHQGGWGPLLEVLASQLTD